MDLLEWLVVLYAFWAMILDLARSRISNQYLLFGWAVGIVEILAFSFPQGLLQFLGGALLPIVLLFILFYFRMMGAGDIKLLSVLGGMIGVRSSLNLIICSFIVGAIFSIGLLFYRRSWSKRFRFLSHYIHNFIMTGIRIPYRATTGGIENLHFAVPVFVAVVLWKGGVF